MGQLHVLLVEPDEILARTYASALRTAGYSVAVAASAQLAVHSADEQIPDVVVLELQLPKHNGVEFLYEFRSYSEWLHIPIIIQSYLPPHSYEHSATLKSELGVVRQLHKQTTNLQQLCAAVRVAAPVVATST